MRSPGDIPILASNNRAASNSAWLAVSLMLLTAESSSVYLSDHRVQGCGWMHDKHAGNGVRRQQQPVARLEAAPFPGGCRQM